MSTATRSTNSSIGGGTSSHRSSKHSGSSSSSSRIRVAPTMMTSIERLQHIRNSLTRIKYIGEKDLHMTTLEPGHEAVRAFFEKLREKVPKLECNPKKVGHEEATYLEYLFAEAKKLDSAARALLEDASSASSASTYSGLMYHHLCEFLRHSEELLAMLRTKPGSMPSRVNNNLINDQVAFHIDEFDAFAEQSLPSFIHENLSDGNLYSASVPDISRDAPPLGIVSVYLLDFAIGVRPGRCAAAVLDHFKRKIDLIDSRVSPAAQILKDQRPAVGDVERARFDGQTREYCTMQEAIKRAYELHSGLVAKWKETEARVEANLLSKQFPNKSLIETKKIAELQIIEDAQKAHDDVVHVCLPFVTPQYCRRHGLTYSQPCQLRVGVRIFDRATQKTFSVHTLAPGYLPLVRAERAKGATDAQIEELAYLFPSQHEVWIRFDDMPEMVKGARCALRDVNTVLDHFRALEEQKEVGAYFLMGGGERILRALLMQRCNVPVCIYRERFVTQGPQFSPKAVVFRCKRASGLTLQNYFYYTTNGDIVFSFARKVVWHVPVTLLLFAMKRDLTPMILFQALTVGLDVSAGHAPRVEALLQHHRCKPYGDLDHMISYLSVLGRMYRQYHQSSNTFRFLPQFHPHLQQHHDAWYGLFLLRRHVLPHLNCDTRTPDLPVHTENFNEWLSQDLIDELERKFEVTVQTCRQLYQFVDGKTEHQGNDVPAYQEVFTVSQVLVGAFEVCLNKYLKGFAYRLGSHYAPTLFRSLVESQNGNMAECESSMKQLRQLMTLCDQRDAGNPLAVMNRLLVTGNFTLDREEDFYCPQTSGWVVMAEHLNFFRFFEQLRCLHRGKTIAGMRSSEVRKYPCESYGFICMVHSPDGEDCGVSNQMSVSTVISSSAPRGTRAAAEIQKALEACMPDILPTDAPLADRLFETMPVWLEGRVIGYIPVAQALKTAQALRRYKSIQQAKLVNLDGIPRRRDISVLNCMEIICIPPNSKESPGLYIFYDSGRLMRPIQKIESDIAPANALSVSTAGALLPFPLTFVGAWEQSWLDIASVPSDLIDAQQQLGKKYEYMEQNGSNMISFTSTTIPYFEYNCSPRNLFQCGLSKQTAGTQIQAQGWRKEAKLFRMYGPQRYICRTLPMDYYGLDDVSLGVNATVAILAYTGYDLDDAIIINHTSVERGMLNAGITVAKIVHAAAKGSTDEDIAVFSNLKVDGTRETSYLEENGLPPKRSPISEVAFDRDHKYPTLQDDTPVYSCAVRSKYTDPIDNTTKYRYHSHQVTKWRHFDKGEAAWVHNIIPLTFDGPDVTSALIVFRIPRAPTVGDKFSSRHGQKGTLPLHIRAVDLPFSARTGLTPDVIINPHAFPSRMTVGMVLEIVAAKMGAIEGRFIDNSAWSLVGDEPRAAELIGDALLRCGYNRYGREQYVDGISGTIMEADVFVGISGYQRLRHMVNDKWQARARTDAFTYRAVTKTGQPVKGRKRHGGVRVGEMERDGLLSHGIAEVVMDRLLHVSDKTKAFVCVECGGMLSIYEKFANKLQSWKACKYCGAGSTEATDNIAMVEIPQVLRLWATELTGIGVRVAINVS
jgi:DNA-directed RNA polymerase I subunit RPA2